jgi:hypothetical protein
VVPLLNGLTTGAWNHLLNFFCPVMKLARKDRVGAQLRRVYDTPATPYARVLASAHVSATTKAALRAQRSQLNPFALNRHNRQPNESHLRHRAAQIGPPRPPPSPPGRRADEDNNNALDSVRTSAKTHRHTVTPRVSQPGVPASRPGNTCF